MTETISFPTKEILIALWPFYVFVIGVLVILFLEIYLYRLMKPWIAQKDKATVNYFFRLLEAIGVFSLLGIVIFSIAENWQSFYWSLSGIFLVIVGFIVMAVILRKKYFKNLKNKM